MDPETGRHLNEAVHRDPDRDGPRRAAGHPPPFDRVQLVPLCPSCGGDLFGLSPP